MHVVSQLYMNKDRSASEKLIRGARKGRLQGDHSHRRRRRSWQSGDRQTVEGVHGKLLAFFFLSDADSASYAYVVRWLSQLRPSKQVGPAHGKSGVEGEGVAFVSITLTISHD